MANPVTGILPAISSIPSLPGTAKTEDTQTSGASFSDYLSKAMNSVDEAAKSAEKVNNLLATGQIDDLHTAMIEVEKADLTLQFTLQIRNKVLDAYNEIMRMQL